MNAPRADDLAASGVGAPTVNTHDSVRVPSTAQIVSLVAAIAVIDVVVTRSMPTPVQLAIKALIVVGLLAWAHFRVGLGWEDLGLARRDAARGVVVGLIAAGAIAVVIAALVLIPTTRSYFADSTIAQRSTSGRALQALFVIPFGTAVFEEVIFRGVLLGILARRTTTVAAVLISAVIFGLWHIPPALTDVSGKGALAALGGIAGTILVTSVAGVAFGYLRVRSRSVWAPVLAHAALNTFSYLGAIVAVEVIAR